MLGTARLKLCGLARLGQPVLTTITTPRPQTDDAGRKAHNFNLGGTEHPSLVGDIFRTTGEKGVSTPYKTPDMHLECWWRSRLYSISTVVLGRRNQYTEMSHHGQASRKRRTTHLPC